MKNLIFFLMAVIIAIGVTSCSKKEDPQKWEYKTIEVYGNSYGNFYARTQPIPQAELDTLGAHGWELVSVYTRTETVHPNFGNEQYVTGLQPNTRTEAVCYVFKRPIMDNSNKKKESSVLPADAIIVEEAVVEEAAIEADTATAVPVQ